MTIMGKRAGMGMLGAVALGTLGAFASRPPSRGTLTGAAKGAARRPMAAAALVTARGRTTASQRAVCGCDLVQGAISSVQQPSEIAQVVTDGVSSLPALTATPTGKSVTVRAARQLNRAAGTLALSVLADSAVEHYRGSFENKAMYTPLVVATLSLAASTHGTADRRGAAHVVRDTIYGLAAVTGLVGTGYHLYNIGKREGGFSWLNLFYAAPVGAPAALSLSGLLGLAAERLRGSAPGAAPRLLGLPAGRAMAAVASAGIAGTVGEVGLLHFRGSFQDPFMYFPVTLPPLASALVAGTALRPSRPLRQVARWGLRLTAVLGFAGVGFHVYGVGRAMGGWRNWSQNVLNGPPIPAPPSFTGLAIAGLAALDLLEDRGND